MFTKLKSKNILQKLTISFCHCDYCYICGVDLDYHLSPYLLLLAAFLTQTVCLDDTTVKFEIWDTAGQERYHSLAPMYYRGAQAAIVVYDITNEARSCTPD